ncbi:MAG: hypothetical protein S4CHLAM123_06800 [Chlamydiales bacterium]|nr:hypothetical protein [Chlamydiales bacterium]
MKYKSGGYSWLGVAPESTVEKEIEKLEDEIHELKKEKEKNSEQIDALELKIQQVKEAAK